MENKTKVKMSLRMRRDLKERLANYSERTMVPMTRVIECALEMYLDRAELTKSNNNKKKKNSYLY